MVRLCGICRQPGHNRKNCPVPVIDLDTPPCGLDKPPQAQAQSTYTVSVQPRGIDPGVGLGSGLVQGLLRVKAEPVDDWGMNAPRSATDIPQSIAEDTINVSMPAPVVTTVSTLGYTPHAAPPTPCQPSPAELFSNPMQCRVCKQSGHDHSSCPLLRQAEEHRRNADFTLQPILTQQPNLRLAQRHQHAKVLASIHPVPPPPAANKPYVITLDQSAWRNVAQSFVRPGAQQQWMVTQGCLYTYTNSGPPTSAPGAAPRVQLATQPAAVPRPQPSIEPTPVQTAGQSSRGAGVVGPAPPPPSSELEKNTYFLFSGYDALSSATTAPLSEAPTAHHPINPLEHPPSSRETSQAPSAPADQLPPPVPKVAKQKMSREEALRRKRERGNAYRRRLAEIRGQAKVTIPVSKPEAASTLTTTSTVPGIPAPTLDPTMKVPPQPQPQQKEPAWSNERISSKLSDAAVAAANPRPRYPAYVPPTPPSEEEIKDALAKEGLRTEGGKVRIGRCGGCTGVGHNVTTCPGVGVRGVG
ncbi:hypothetical protein SAICODRAFT_131065 [Saitoella complicata NRRL Y-17804]|uniref:uncharacterized protein n=1 Tax=Saitoella complicata (strain BCRC 22490 / CBS 7301 / JCM 7358 / NBRC 10748 / NRRL Y-17804) TaxID=698492 RepID=UPI000866FEB2|nr:uncharacterized protein SAICODRAFT_131065 [Saitoella complicata NRRL Y-17804]ODQ52591.1 hypothetical protein SAICODRAFT_131065 [Saitoella complicata NRRL Y-17804]